MILVDMGTDSSVELFCDSYSLQLTSDGGLNGNELRQAELIKQRSIRALVALEPCS